jgi:hypothetical protein
MNASTGLSILRTGWEYPLEPDEVLARLVELNVARAEQGASTFA